RATPGTRVLGSMPRGRGAETGTSDGRGGAGGEEHGGVAKRPAVFTALEFAERDAAEGAARIPAGAGSRRIDVVGRQPPIWDSGAINAEGTRWTRVERHRA